MTPNHKDSGRLLLKVVCMKRNCCVTKSRQGDCHRATCLQGLNCVMSQWCTAVIILHVESTCISEPVRFTVSVSLSGTIADPFLLLLFV
jgi:hypothetical protein